MKKCLYISSAFSAAFFCWAVFTVNTALGADALHDGEGYPDLTHGAGDLVDLNTHHDAGGGGLPQLDVSTYPSQLFWLAIAFALMYFIFSRKSLPEISSVLENRQQHIESDLSHADSLKKDAEKAQLAYESSLVEARAKAHEAMHDAQETIQAKADKQSEEFRARVEQDIQALERSLQKAKEAAMDDMNTIAAEVASEAAKKIVGINPDIEQAKTVVKSLNTPDTKAA